jgi:hypothetical protein
MSLTPNEAADALRDIEATSRRSGQAFGYRIAGPHFILWGIVWLIGYAASDFFPPNAGNIWLALVAVGALASAVVGRATAGATAKARPGSTWKPLALFAIVALFIFATYTVMWPIKPAQQAAFVPLLTAAVYSGVGLWAGLRWIVAGVAIAALTLGGYFFIHEHFSLYMAVVGGGGLILAGLWMRSA